MSPKIMAENTIAKCSNPICQLTFSVISYSFDDTTCRIIGSAQMVPLTGNTPYFCPACGKNLGATERRANP